MQAERITDRSIEIYLQIAHSARSSNDKTLTNKMLIAAYEQVKNSDNKPLAKTLTNLAELLLLNKNVSPAEEMYNLAFKICKQSNTANNWLLARIFDGLAEVYCSRSDFEKARKKCEQAIKIISSIPDFDPALLRSRLRKLALLTLQQGQAERARELCENARVGLTTSSVSSLGLIAK